MTAPKSLLLYGASTLVYGTLAYPIVITAAFTFSRVFLILQMVFTLSICEFCRCCFERGVWLFLPSLCYLLVTEVSLKNFDSNVTPYFAVVHRHFPLLIALAGTMTHLERFGAQDALLLALVLLSCYGSKLAVLIAYDYEFWRLVNAFIALFATAFLYVAVKRIQVRLKFTIVELVYVNSFNVLLFAMLEEYIEPQLLDAAMTLMYSPPAFWAQAICFLIAGTLNHLFFFNGIARNGALKCSLVHATASALQVCALYPLGAFDTFDFYPSAFTLIGVVMNLASTAGIFIVLQRKSSSECKA